MATERTLTLDQNDVQVCAAAEAEQQLLKHYGLEAQIHYVEVSDPKIRVRVLEVGSGPAVLMVPGGVGDAFIFIPLMAELKGYRFIAVNRPGGGMSDGVDHRAVDFRAFAVRVLASVLEAFNLTNVPVIGNSMGGLWSFWLALDQAEKVSRIVQMGAPALIPSTSAPFFMRLMSVPRLNQLMTSKLMVPNSRESARTAWRFLGLSQEVCAAFPDEWVECGYQFPRLPTFGTAWASLMERILTIRGPRADLQLKASDLKRVQQAVQFIWGNTDPFGSLDDARQAKEAIPGARLDTVTGSHLPWLDSPIECGRLIRQFLEG